jgi:hypothetical protein
MIDEARLLFGRGAGYDQLSKAFGDLRGRGPGR